MKYVLLTGGSGFIGNHFQQVIPQEHIVNLDLVEPSFKTNSLYLNGDIRKIEDVETAIKAKPVDTIISLAAMHHDFGVTEEQFFSTNEFGTRVICEAATKHDIKTIVFFSSVAVYGANVEPSTENTAINPNGPYGASKFAGEEVLKQWAAANASRIVLIMRPALVFGVNNIANMHKLIHQIDRGIYFHVGKADNIKSIAYVGNLVKATLWLLRDMKPGVSVYNYADEPHLTSKEIATTIADALGKKIRIALPTALAIGMGLPFDLLIRLTGKNLPVSSARIKKLATATFHSAQKLFDKGFKAECTTKEGLRKMVSWYLSRKGEKNSSYLKNREMN